jgi:hypothetical protein
MNRRGFLQSCIALAAAPAIVRADSLMRVIPREATVILPQGFGLAQIKREGSSIPYMTIDEAQMASATVIGRYWPKGHRFEVIETYNALPSRRPR